MEPVISKWGWHWDYYGSLVKALTFLFLFHDPRFGLGGNCSHPIPKTDWLPSWSPKLQRSPLSRKAAGNPVWQQTGLLLEAGYGGERTTTDFTSQSALH